MIYPCILILVGLIAIVFVMTFVVPRIRMLLEQQVLPWPTMVVFGLSDLIAQQYLAILAVLLIVVIAVGGFFRTALGRLLWARLQLRMWGIGRIYTMVALCRFCRIFGTLLANGIQILNALRIAKDSTGNQILAEAIDQAADSVGSGESLTTPLSRSGVFPPTMLDMISVAEESNTLDRVLVEIADTQEARTARQIDLFVRLLEPLMLLLMGAMLLFIAIALLLPILRMATSGIR
jgi:general secretion pathway protein F